MSQRIDSHDESIYESLHDSAVWLNIRVIYMSRCYDKYQKKVIEIHGKYKNLPEDTKETLTLVAGTFKT